MISSVEKGDRLRDYVIQLLEADGNRVSREHRANTKRIDIILTLDDEYVPRTVAIECKNVDHIISQQELVVIYSDHLSLIESKRVNEVWVIARRDFSPEAKNWADQRANLFTFSLAEFEERRHGFRKYVRQVTALFQEDDLNHYYIQQRLPSGEFLRDYVFRWIEAEDMRPIALLGGYGMGKTSFCRYLVSELSSVYLQNPMSRVPIYVRLSDIAKQQELDGLIAKTLAERYRIKDYYFEKFKRLNEYGKFVLIFDGFDEMKHALSWSEFKFNFSQINSTIKKRAKVIVAGRPNAFLSDDEHSWVLRGVRLAGERSTRLPDWPEYDELEIQPFSEADAREFLRLYLSNHLSRAAKGASLSPSDIKWINERVHEFEQIKRRDDIFRPVHLRIFSDIAADASIRLRDFNVFELYQLATSRISERESTKIERAPIDSAARQTVIEDTAWWLWDRSDGRALSFRPTEVPSSIVRRAFPRGSEYDDEAMYREIFSGSFVERKFGENYFFSHRSFVEFFVAKKLSRSREADFSLALINKNFNPEILAFMAEGKLSEPFLDYVLHLMQRYAGTLQLYLLNAIAYHLKTKKSKMTLQIPVKQIFRYLPIYDGLSRAEAVDQLMGILTEDFVSDNQEEADSALYFGVDFVRLNLQEPSARPVAELVVSKCMNQVKWSHWKIYHSQPSIPKLRFSRNDLFEYVLLRNARMASEFDREGRRVVLVDFERLFNDIYLTRLPRITVAGTEPATAAEARPLRFLFSDVSSQLTSTDQSHAIEVLQRGSSART